MLITMDEYRECLRKDYSFFFRGCAVRERRAFVFLTEPSLSDAQVEEEEKKKWDPSLRPKAAVTYVIHFPAGQQWSAQYFHEWKDMIVGAAQQPLNQAVYAESFAPFPSMERRVFVSGSGPAHEDGVITSLSKDPQQQEKGHFARGAIMRFRAVNGFLYACGGGRAMAKRLGKGHWQSFTQEIPSAGADGVPVGNAGFKDFDAWDENDVYAVGGHGDVWHFDGSAWRQVAFPSNEVLNSVCCGDDGNVYISGYEGVTWMGRGDTWRKIHNGGISLGFRDMVWYEDKVWCTSDYGLWTIENGRVRSADVPPEVSACSGHLAVGDGILLLAGLSAQPFEREANGR